MIYKIKKNNKKSQSLMGTKQLNISLVLKVLLNTKCESF